MFLAWPWTVNMLINNDDEQPEALTIISTSTQELQRFIEILAVVTQQLVLLGQ